LFGNRAKLVETVTKCNRLEYSAKKFRLTAKEDGWLKKFQKIVKRLRKRLDKAEWLW
jgi:hypothetical protein